MKWDKYTIEVNTEAVDIISAALCELGIEGIEIENNVPLTEEEVGSMFIDFPLQMPEDDGTSRVSFYLESTDLEGAGKAPCQEHKEQLDKVCAAIEHARCFMEIGSGKITSTRTADEDWVNNWKQFFKAFTIDDILIKPTWETFDEADADKILIEIDPGISFGTGKHETTQLCIRQLKKYIEGSPKVLDIGCGSGILSIVALKLGAAFVNGIDIDENCITSAYENMAVNHLDESRGKFYVGDLITDEELQRQVGDEAYEIVVANILAEVIMPMAPEAWRCLKPGGVFITSGIIDFKEKEVRGVLVNTGFEILETNYQGEWVNITARKSGCTTTASSKICLAE